MASEKNLHHFCFWHPPLFNFNIVILLPGTKGIFLPDGLKRFLLQLASPLTNRSGSNMKTGLVRDSPIARNYTLRYLGIISFTNLSATLLN